MPHCNQPQNVIGPTEQDRLAYRMLSEAQAGAARERMCLQDEVERALTGGAVPLPELDILDVDLQREATALRTRVHDAFEAVKGAEKALADVEANPQPGETAQRWRSTLEYLILCRSYLHKAQGEAYMLRAEIERRARR